MHSVRKTLSAITLAAVFSTGAAFAQHDDHHDDHGGDHGGYVKHSEWHKGGKINHDDWNRGEQVDWHAHHLQQPRSGYEWRQVDGNYVLAAVATGVIASTIIAAGR
jgi:Ni/Co efflux regulator RcnB